MTNLKQAIRFNIEEVMQGLYTNIPASIISYDAPTQTCSVQPLINYTFNDGFVLQDSVVTEVPVVFPSAGGGIISFPIQRGDTVLLCFSMRSIDRWVEEGGEVTPSETRLHDLNDAIAIPGLYPKTNSQNPSADDVEIKFKGNRVTLKANGDIQIDGGRIDLGDAASESVVLGDSLKGYLDTHTHAGVTTGGGVSGPPSTPVPASALSNKVYTE